MKLWVSRDTDGDIRIHVDEPKPADEGSIGTWVSGDKEDVFSHGECPLFDRLIEAIGPLSPEGLQLAELEVREVKRWERT